MEIVSIYQVWIYFGKKFKTCTKRTTLRFQQTENTIQSSLEAGEVNFQLGIMLTKLLMIFN